MSICDRGKGKMEVANFGIYMVKSGNTVIYIGSTSLPLTELENNHRRFRLYNYTESKFRKALEKSVDFKFSWALEPRQTSRQMIEIEESCLIRHYSPVYNSKNTWGQFPWKASIHNERYQKQMTIL